MEKGRNSDDFVAYFASKLCRYFLTVFHADESVEIAVKLDRETKTHCIYSHTTGFDESQVQTEELL